MSIIMSGEGLFKVILLKETNGSFNITGEANTSIDNYKSFLEFTPLSKNNKYNSGLDENNKYPEDYNENYYDILKG